MSRLSLFLTIATRTYAHTAGQTCVFSALGLVPADGFVRRGCVLPLLLRGFGAGAAERLDAQVLLDPLEEQLDVPAAAIQVRDCVCRQYEVVGQKNQPLLPFWGEESDDAPTLGVSLHRVEPLQQDRLIALNAGLFVDLVGDQAPEAEVLSCSYNEKSAGQSPAMEPRKIQVSAVHDIEGPRLQHDVIEELKIAQLGRCDADNRGDVASQIQERMELHGMLIGLVGRPGKQAEAQIDSSRVQ